MMGFGKSETTTHVSIRTDFSSGPSMLAEAFRNQLTRSAARRPHPAYRTLSQKPPQAPFRPFTRAVPPRDRQQLPRPPRQTMRQVASISPRACPTPCRPYPSKSDSRPSSWCEDLAGPVRALELVGPPRRRARACSWPPTSRGRSSALFGRRSA